MARLDREFKASLYACIAAFREGRAPRLRRPFAQLGQVQAALVADALDDVP